MKSTQPNILIVNDDGITAPGIKALMHVMKEIGRVVVVPGAVMRRRNY